MWIILILILLDSVHMISQHRRHENMQEEKYWHNSAIYCLWLDITMTSCLTQDQDGNNLFNDDFDDQKIHLNLFV